MTAYRRVPRATVATLFAIVRPATTTARLEVASLPQERALGRGPASQGGGRPNAPDRSFGGGSVASGPGGSPDLGPRWLAARLLHNVTPGLIGIPVLAGIISTLVSLLSARHPDLGWAHTVANDAKAVALGDALYADPSDQYSGMLYGPLYPVVLAPLYVLRWWDGWAPLVSMLAGLALAVAVAFVAARPVEMDHGQRRLALLGGVGLGGLAWWLVSANPEHVLYEGRSDQMAWCLALVGLCVLAAAASRGEGRTWPAVALLVAATWTKPTTVGASVAAVVGITAWMAMGVVPRPLWRRFCSALLGLNVVVAAVLWLGTGGWAWHFLVTLPARHSSDAAVAKYVGELVTILTAPMLVLAAPAVALVMSSRIRVLVKASWRSGHLPFGVALVTLMLLFVVFSLPPTWLARRKQGGDSNQYVGMVWAIGLMIAAVHRECRRRRWSMVVGATTYALLALAVVAPSLQPALLRVGIAYPATHPASEQGELSSELVDYARTHEVYLPDRGLVSVTRPQQVWPAQWNVNDLLAAGDRPGYLLDALIERRFDAVEHFDARWDTYASSHDGEVGSYLHLLNALIDRGYVEGANGAPPPLLGRRDGQLDLGWARPCFEPGAISVRCQSLLRSAP